MPTSDQTRATIIQEARAWLGTPFRHQAASRGVGVDDWGLVRAVGEACGLLTIEAEAFARFEGYRPQATSEAIAERLAAFLSPIAAERAGPGDVVQLGGQAAILAEHQGRATLIRAHGSGNARVLATGAQAHFVVEHGFRDPWPARAVGFYRYQGL